MTPYYSYGRESAIASIFKNPFRFIEISDVLEDPHKASVFFADLLVHRPTEFSAFMHLYMIASHNLDLNRVNLTNRQSEAITLARQAMQQNLHPTRYVASKLHVSPRSVQRLLKRASMRAESEMVAIGSEVHTSNISSRWKPTRAQIQAQIAKTPRECAACSKSIQGRFTLCYECSKRFGFTREEWNQSKRQGEPAPAKWLLPEARRLDVITRKSAVNELFRAHGFSGQDFEEALEQYDFQNAS